MFPGFVASQISTLVNKQAVDTTVGSVSPAITWLFMKKLSAKGSVLGTVLK